jgi:hypothetical protein
MTKSILLVTTNNANNYGAVLQAYALLQKLSKFGSVTTLNYDNRHVGSSMDFVRIKPSLRGLLGFAKDICRLKSRISVIRKFARFSEERLNLSIPTSKLSLAEHPALDYDVFVSGSDQIWNPNCIDAKGKIDETYFLNFAPKEKTKISYASSWGGFQPAAAERDTIQRLLSSYSQISVRESDTKDFLENLLKRRVYHSLDPTLLLSAEEWQSVISDGILARVPPKFILMYSVPKLPLVLQAIRRFSKLLGLPIVVLDQDPYVPLKGSIHIKNAGPQEFLALFKSAAFVVTDSFHGTCFSITFEVPFVVISQGVHSNRISSLLRVTGLESRLIGDATSFGDIELDVNFDAVREKLRAERKRDLSYLSMAVTSDQSPKG